MMNISRSLVALTLAACSLPLLSADEINNDWLTDGGASWKTKHAPGMNMSASVTTEDGQNALQVVVADVAADSSAPADARIYRTFGGVDAGQSYLIRLQAKAAQPGRVIVFIHPQDAPQQVLLRKDISVDQEWNDFTIKFTAKETTSNCVLGFAGLGQADNTFTFRAITVEH